MRTPLKLISLVSAGLALSGCTKRNYAASITNATGQLIHDAHVVDARGNESVGGAIPPGVSKTEFGFFPTIPDDVTVRWKDEAGHAFTRRVEVRSRLSASMNQEVIVFTLLSDGEVRVHSKP